MELEQPNPEKETSDHDHQQQSGSGGSQLATIRSYECTFCKRGFSNAQALGGHMNIHRKDKAKLRQASSNIVINETPPPPPQQQQQQYYQQPNLDIPKMSTSNSPIPMNSLEAKSTIPRWPWFLTSEGAPTDHANTSLIRAADQNRVGDPQLVQQLPLFAVTPPDHHNDQKPAVDHHNHQAIDHEKIEKGLSSTSSSSSGSELDLELRLGPEPQDSSPPAVGTRKFF